MQDSSTNLLDNLVDLAVEHRQDQVLYVHQDGTIELIEPYHRIIKKRLIGLGAGVRAYAADILHDKLLPPMELRSTL